MVGFSTAGLYLLTTEFFGSERQKCLWGEQKGSEEIGVCSDVGRSDESQGLSVSLGFVRTGRKDE
jgi:hypothetical protein